MARSKMPPKLFDAPGDCCGCGACAATCRRGAIAMIEDSRGFVFPRIDSSICVGCGACEKACGIRTHRGIETSGPWYAACGMGDISDSASGGLFATFACQVIHEGGCAVGAAYVIDKKELCVNHRIAEDYDTLKLLLNSKYVQSNTETCFPDIKERLNRGQEVFYCGTPCQVAGLKGYLGREWPNLVTADLVCHGVPSARLFHSYLEDLAEKYNSPVVDFRFRCKRNGWGHSLLLLRLEDGREIPIPSADSPYYDMFMNLKVQRDSCYSCQYAGSFRAADITLGDFWGIESSRPDLLKDGELDVKRGISCLLINNNRGFEFMQHYGKKLVLKEVSLDDITRGNEQLRHPSKLSIDREIYLNAFEKRGWSGISSVWYHRERGAWYSAKRLMRSLIGERGIKWYKKLFRAR